MKRNRKLLVILLFLTFAGCLFGTAQKADASSKYKIYVNRKSNIVNVVNKKGDVVRAMYCSTGVGYATIKGSFRTQDKMRWHTLAHGVYGQYCTRIHGSYLFHSVWYYSTKKNQVSIDQYNKLGKQASMGCVRLAVVDAKWIYDNCPTGTKVIIGESKKLKKPDRKKIKLSSSKTMGWDPTDPDPDNPYYPKIKLKDDASTTIAFGSEFDPLAQIKVSSRLTKKKELIKHVQVKGSVDTNTPGEYKLVYKVTDPRTLLSKKLKVTYVVGDKPPEEVAPAAVAADQAPAPEQPPADQAQPPADQAQPPADQAPAPTDQAPAEQTPAPDQTPAPADQAPAPEQTPAPADQAPAPEQTPAPADQAPAPADQAPVPADQTPAPTDQAPAPADQTPASADQAPPAQ